VSEPYYNLLIDKNADSVVIEFQPVAKSSRRRHLLFGLAFEGIFLTFTILLWSRWWARIFFPVLAIYGAWGIFRRLAESQKITLSRDSFTIAKFNRGQRISIATCKPWFLTNVKFEKRGKNNPSSIACEVEGRFRRFAEGISEGDAYSVLSELLDSGFLPKGDEVHFP
jgi:hypothetical protein